MIESPIIIVGAGRSGSKLLRRVLGAAPDTVIFPREINYIWRHGNIAFPTDELRPEHARPPVQQYIQKRFAQFSSRHDNKRIIEKTCANALRISFIHEVFPDARIVHIIRDGRAVAESARRRWTGKTELSYLLEKARWVPATDVPFYALRYLRYQAGRFDKRNELNHQSSWGPRFAGFDQLVATMQLIEVCGIQWRTCVEQAAQALANLPTEQAATIYYEQLVSRPVETAYRLYTQFGLNFTEQAEQYIRGHVSTDTVTRWEQGLSDQDLQLLMPHIADTLLAHGYAI